MEEFKLKLHRPFGPTIGQSLLPQDIIDDFNKDCESLMDDPIKKKAHDHSQNLAGNVKQELIINSAIFKKYAPYFNGLCTAYIAACPSDLYGPDALKKFDFQSGWYVRSFAGDFNPAHFHSNCHLSTVGYLKMPEGMKEEWDREDKEHFPSAGNIEMQFGQCQIFTNNTFRARPKVGDFYVFPWWMYHMVYPFRSKGERRSFSFNVFGKPK